MARVGSAFWGVLIVLNAGAVGAQHHSGHSSQQSPFHHDFHHPMMDGYPAGLAASQGFLRRHGLQYGLAVIPPLIVPSPTPTLPVIPVIPVTQTKPIETDPAKRPAKPSTPAGRMKNLEYMSRGDDKMRKQLWGQAYVAYRTGVDAAGDQGEGHFRLGFAYTAMQNYTAAIREFKRGLFLTPDLAANGIKMSALFGPNSEIVRVSIFHKVADWVRDDSRDPDRLFLLGLLLHYEDDPRRREVLQAARKMAGGKDEFIVALLTQPDVPGNKKVLLENLPPLPDGPNLPPALPDIAAPAVGPPQPPPPIGLPPLLDKATPPVLGLVGKA